MRRWIMVLFWLAAVSAPNAGFGQQTLTSDAIEVGESYRLIGAETPLMPVRRPGEGKALGAISEMRYMPAGTVVHVIDIDRSGGLPWYRVSLPEHSNRVGWINSVALMPHGVERVAQLPDVEVAASFIDHRAEIEEYVVDPCILSVVRKEPELDALGDDDAVVMMKVLNAGVWETVVDQFSGLVSGVTDERRYRIYGNLLGICQDLYG